MSKAIKAAETSSAERIQMLVLKDAAQFGSTPIRTFDGSKFSITFSDGFFVIESSKANFIVKVPASNVASFTVGRS